MAGLPSRQVHLIGKPHVAMPRSGIPRFVGKAMYATRLSCPTCCICKLLISPHPRSRAKVDRRFRSGKNARRRLHPDAENGPGPTPCRRTFFQGEVVAIIAGETEDQAEDAVAEIEVEYKILPFASSLQQTMAPNPPDLSTTGDGRPRQVVKIALEWGDVDKAFAQSDVVKEFSYNFGGGFPFRCSRSAA